MEEHPSKGNRYQGEWHIHQNFQEQEVFLVPQPQQWCQHVDTPPPEGLQRHLG